MDTRILVVEDDENVRDTIVFMLSHAGFQISTCASGKGIFNTIEQHQPHLILLDILLGELNGRDICKAIKNNRATSHIPVIIVSSMHNIYNAIADEGANDVISKPFTEETLLNRVNRQLSRMAS